jgi:hypothetical protein
MGAGLNEVARIRQAAISRYHHGNKGIAIAPLRYITLLYEARERDRHFGRKCSTGSPDDLAKLSRSVCKDGENLFFKRAAVATFFPRCNRSHKG